MILKAKRTGGEKLLKVDKVTDSVVEAWYRTQPEYIDAVEEVVEAEFDYNMLDGGMDAIKDRKHEMQDLVTLYLADYFSDPKEPEGSGMEEKARKVSRDKQRAGLKNSINRSKK